MINTETLSATPARSGALSSRPTLGFVLMWGVDNEYSNPVWSGIMDAAREFNVNLLSFAGRKWSTLDDEIFNPAVFEQINTANLDGLVVILSELKTIKRLKGYGTIPIVTIGTPNDELPGLITDNYGGMKAEIAHLIEQHGRKRIAFIRTWDGHPDGDARLKAYWDVLAEHNLPCDPRLVFGYDFLEIDAAEQITHTFIEQQIEFDAIAAASDKMAIGAMHALEKHGLRVPYDVSVVGFDDIPEASFTTSPLSTARQPLEAMGRRAVEILLAQLSGEQVAEREVLPPILVRRQSCGCFSENVLQRNSSSGNGQVNHRAQTIAEMTQGPIALDAGWAERLFDALVTDVNNKTSDNFLIAVDEISRQLISQATAVTALNGWLSILRHQARPMWADNPAALGLAEDLWQKASAFIGEAALRQQAQNQAQLKAQTTILREFGEVLITTFDIKELMELVSHNLPRFGINSCYLALYTEPGKVSEKAQLILAQKEGQKIELDEAKRSIFTHELVHSELLPEQRFNLLTMPLYFREAWLGYVIFEVGSREGAIYEALRGELSSALQGALLVQQMEEHAAVLARQQYVLDTFMENIPDRVYFKDAQNRLTRTNKALAVKLGVKDATELIGKSDFDFFPKEQAEIKHQQELAIMQTGQPILGLEEADGIDHWALTTKMPLRDEKGAIIGTFGISHDITEQIKAKQTAEAAKDEAIQARKEALAEKESAEKARRIAEAAKEEAEKAKKDTEIANRTLAAQIWQTNGQALLNERMRGEQELATLANNVIEQLCIYLAAPVGALYALEDTKLTLAGAYAYRRKSLVEQFELGEGLVGQAAKGKRTINIQLPDDYIKITSTSLGEIMPRHVIFAPLAYDGQVVGVVEMGALTPFTQEQLEFLNIAIESVAIAFMTAQARQRVNELLVQTRRQAEELQAQEEELRATNEELEAQTESLRTSETRLKTNQAALEAANANLEENTHVLQQQQAELDRQNKILRDAQQELERKAEELAMASKYKSEFLANMSHELRTPLNSMLILASMLAKNDEGNLTADQVESAQVIHSGGTDLLNLINEILDLAKVEAGKMEFHFAPMAWEALIERMKAQFGPIAQRKGLQFPISIANDLPAGIVTDEQRLAQIIKNLLSNAFKFTEQGSVALTIQRAAPGSGFDPAQFVGISVMDTGIGMTPQQQKVVFEAFQQADGSTSRQYGGTGLGLTITREMTQHLGGQVTLTSEPGKGSTFTIYLPLKAEDGKVENQPSDHQPSPINPSASSGQALQRTIQQSTIKNQQSPIPDDRDDIEPSDRILLIVEDDPKFAKIVLNYAHKKHFKCLVAGDGESALALTKTHRPAAIILDLKLPGMSGWDVLDAIKDDPDTRHIPIHIMSVDDEDISAYQRGAMGFLTKPISQKELEGAFGKIEAFISNKIRSLLMVEDDAALRLSVRKLLEGSDISITEAATGQAALKQLTAQQFDCMILDLSLPDISGFEMLNRLDSDETLPKCPVIIYTGKELSPEENQELLKYADSVIIKGIKSPERLLDETALFLHRVVADLPADQQQTIRKLHNREAVLQGKQILIVDDDARNAFALSKLLAERGVKMHIAASATKALEKLEHLEVSLILTDIMMPGMDGYEFIKALRQQPSFQKLPIIALTAKAMKGDREKCIEAGANDYLSKPIDPERLFSMLRVWLSRE
jgi:CheY-like chemotaxis protein/signal transduction histidine kinase/DNA-binding LacI/PurR family transcriptional regulator/PAS domain-containing protein